MATLDVRLGTGAGTPTNPLLQRAERASAPDDKATDKADDKADAEIKERLRQDTVSLSEGGQKIVNLNRGRDLSAEIKTAAIDESFADKLWKATQDVFRVNQVFQQSSRALFGWWKRS